MGKKELQKLEVKYDPQEIQEKKEIWDNLEDLQKRGIIEDWKLTGIDEVDTNADTDP